MLRSEFTIMAVIGAVLGAPNIGTAQPKGKPPTTGTSTLLELGKKFEDDIGLTKKKLTVRVPGASLEGVREVYVYAIGVQLKEGQQIVIAASVVGDGRSVGIQFFDPSDTLIFTGGNKGGVRSTPLEAKTKVTPEITVSATGRYTIVVVSDRIGRFTLRATSDSMEESRESLEKELQSLKKKVEEVEAKLKALDAKSKQ